MKTTHYYERIIRRLRQRMFNYPDTKQEQAGRVLRRCKAKCSDDWADRHYHNHPGNAYANVMWM